MNRIPEAQLQVLRHWLSQRATQLREEISLARRDTRERHAERLPEALDRKDEATDRIQAGMDHAEIERDIHELDHVAAAQARLEDGSYGECADCGEPIALERLLAQPAALRCAPCQAAQERASARLGRS